MSHAGGVVPLTVECSNLGVSPLSQEEVAAPLLLEVTVDNLPTEKLAFFVLDPSKSAGTVGSLFAVCSQAKLPLIYKCRFPYKEQLEEENYVPECVRTENIPLRVNG